MAVGFEWTEYGRSRQLMYHTIASFGQVNQATHKVAREVAARARSNLAAQHHHIRIVPHSPYYIEIESGGGKYPVASWNVSLVGDNPAALEYGHQPSGAFGPEGRFGHLKTKAPAGTYVLHRAADLPGKVTHPRMSTAFRRQTGRT